MAYTTDMKKYMYTGIIVAVVVAAGIGIFVLRQPKKTAKLAVTPAQSVDQPVVSSAAPTIQSFSTIPEMTSAIEKQGLSLTTTPGTLTVTDKIWTISFMANTGGYSIKVNSADRATGKVSVTINKPGADCIVTQSFTKPAVTVAMPNTITKLDVTTYETTNSCSIK
jgi:hypothetical protein